MDDRNRALLAMHGGVLILVAPIHDTAYGMREFIVRDPNRFWLTFGMPVPGGGATA